VWYHLEVFRNLPVTLRYAHTWPRQRNTGLTIPKLVKFFVMFRFFHAAFRTWSCCVHVVFSVKLRSAVVCWVCFFLVVSGMQDVHVLCAFRFSTKGTIFEITFRADPDAAQRCGFRLTYSLKAWMPISGHFPTGFAPGEQKMHLQTNFASSLISS